MIKIFVFLLALFFAQGSFGQADDIAPNWDSARGNAARDIENFGRSLYDNFTPEGTWLPRFVPIEARIGVMFMSALGDVIVGLYKAVIPFLNAFIALLLMFWFFMETWAKMKSGDGKWLEFGKKLALKMVWASFWIWIMNNNPAEIFMVMMAPLIALGSLLADTILNMAANIIGTNLPDTCGPIHQWLAARDDLLITGSQAADLICLPTRPLWFLYTTVVAGLTWILQGLLQLNPLMIIMGLVFVFLFAYNIFTFSLRAIGVILDLFFILLFLPFTAMKEAVGKKPDYNGIGTDIWEKFAGFIKGVDMQSQIERFAKVIIYFVIISIIASLAIALLSTVNPFEWGNFFTILVVGCLVSHLLSKSTIESQFNINDSFVKELWNNVKGAATGIATKAKSTWDLIQKNKAAS